MLVEVRLDEVEEVEEIDEVASLSVYASRRRIVHETDTRFAAGSPSVWMEPGLGGSPLFTAPPSASASP